VEALGHWPEFLIVTGAAFGLFVIGSLKHLFYAFNEPSITASHLQGLVVYEILVFVILWWFLRQRGWTFASMGKMPALRDFPIGIALSVACYCITYITLLLVVLAAPRLGREMGSVALVGGRFALSTVLIGSIVNATFEETFLCGYTVTALEKGNKTA